MGEFVEVARVLGLKTGTASGVAYLDLVDRGLPIGSLERIATCVAPGDRNFKYRIVPKASLARSKSQHRLSAGQSVVISRLASVWATAARIWKSDEAARDFLTRRHPLLEQRRPIDLILENEIGAELVKSVLGRLEYGAAV
jgi:putative toxin-antitoxin system antitoxin component (TIGR02293 family)